MLRPDTFGFPRNLIKTNRKEIVVMSGQLYSNAVPPPLSKGGLGEKKTKTMKWRARWKKGCSEIEVCYMHNPTGRKAKTSESLS